MATDNLNSTFLSSAASLPMTDYASGTFLATPRLPEIEIPIIGGVGLNNNANSQYSGISTTSPINQYVPYTPFEADPISVSEGMGEFRKGLNRGWENLQASGYAFAGLLGDLTNKTAEALNVELPNLVQGTADAVTTWGMEGYERNVEEASQYPAAVSSFRDIDSVGSAADWLAGTAGSLVPTMGALVLPGGIIGGATRTLGGAAISKAVSQAISAAGTNAAKVATARSAEVLLRNAVAKSATTRAAAALGTISSAVEAGSNWGDNVTERGIENTNPYSDLAFGVASGLSEVVLGAEVGFLRSIFGRPISRAAEEAVKRSFVRAIGSNALQEGGQEALQEALSIVNRGVQDHNIEFTSDDFMSLLDAAAAGMVGGVALSPTLINDVRKNNKAIDEKARIRANSAINDNAVPKLTDPFKSVVDADAIREQQRIKNNPYEQAKLEYEAVMQQETQRAEQEATTVARNYDTTLNKLTKTYDGITRNIAAIDSGDGSVARYNQMSRDQLSAERSKLEKNLARTSLMYQQTYNNRDNALAEIDKRLGNTKAKEELRLRSAAEAQARIDLNNTVNSSPELAARFRGISDDVATFANRLGAKFDKQLEDLSSAINSVKRNTRTIARQNAPIADSVRKFSGRYTQSLQKKIADTRKLRDRLSVLANDLIVSMENASPASLAQLNSKLQEMYSIANLAIDNFDVYTEGAGVLQDINVENLNSIADSLRNASNAIAESSIADTIPAYTMQGLLRQAELEAQRDAENIRANEVAERAQAEQQAQDANKAEQQYNLSVQEAARRSLARTEEELVAEEELAQEVRAIRQQQIADALRQNVLSENPADFYRGINTPQGMLAQNAMQSQLSDMDEVSRMASETRNEQALGLTYLGEESARNEAVRASEVQDKNGAEFVENKNYSDNGKQVRSWLRNALGRLPLLRDNVIFVDNINSISLPTALHNGLYQIRINGGMPPTGAYYNGKVYIFCNNIQNKDMAIRTLVHEGVGHYGLRSILSNRAYTKFVRDVWRSFADISTANSDSYRKWQQFINNRSNATTIDPDGLQRKVFADNVSQETMVDEFVSWIAENDAVEFTRAQSNPKSIYKRVYDFFWSLLKNLGLVRINEGDIRDVLSLSSAYLAGQYQTSPNIGGDSMLTPSGEEIELQDSGTRVFGLYFKTPGEIRNYANRLGRNTSGIPGDNYNSYYIGKETAINLDETMANQFPFLKEIFADLIPNGLDITQEQDGYHVTLVGKPINQVFATQEEAQGFANSDALLASVTGQDVYDYLTNTLGGKNNASRYLTAHGITSATHATPNGTAFILLTGDTNALDMVDINVPYTTPLFMQQDPNTELSYGTELADPTPTRNAAVIQNIKDKYDWQTRWINKMKGVIKSGVSFNEDGKVEYSTFERIVEDYTDEHRSIKMIQALVEETSPTYKAVDENGNIQNYKTIDYETNIYKRLTGLINRINARKHDAKKNLIDPLVGIVKQIHLPQSILDEFGITEESSSYTEMVYYALGEYATAVHADERNAEIARRSGGSIQRGSGMSSTEARRIREKYADIPGFKEALDHIHIINDTRLIELRNANIISKSTYDKLKSTYQFYVPLGDWDAIMKDLGPASLTRKKGAALGGKNPLKYATGMGETTNAVNPVIQSINQYFDTIGIVEKNRVARGFLELVKRVPDKRLWEISDEKGTYEWYERKEGGEGLRRVVRSKNGKITTQDKSHALEGEGFSYVNVIDENSKLVRIAVKDDTLAKALRGENRAPTGAIVDSLARLTRLVSSIQTTYSVNFAFTNWIRDMETAVANMGNVFSENEKIALANQGESVRKNILKNTINATNAKFLFQVVRGKFNPNTETDPVKQQLYKDYVDFSQYGARTRMFDMYNFENVEKQLIKLSKNPNSFTDNASLAWGQAISFLDNLSDVSENMARFSTYRAVNHALNTLNKQLAKEEGWTPERINLENNLAKEKAANIALESTVNFTRRGAKANIFNALFAFSSATIQGNVRIMKNLWRKDSTPAENYKRLSKYIAVGAAAMLAQGALCRMWMGEDDGISKYDKIPDYIKYRNIILPLPGTEAGYIKIPMAYGYNVFAVIGLVLDSALHGTKSAGAAATDIIKESFSAWSPIDPTSEGFTAWIPTVFRPIAQVAANTTFSGIPIYPENTGSAIPDSQKYWAKTPDGYKQIAGFLNRAFGGDDVTSGLVDISPESIEHVTNGYLGGTFRTIVDAISLASATATGKDIDVSKVPVASRFVGAIDFSSTSALYNRVSNKVEAAKNAYDIALKSIDMPQQQRMALRQEYASAYRLANLQSTTRRALTDIRRQEEAYTSKHTDVNKDYWNTIKGFENRRKIVMQRLLSAARREGLPYVEE